MLVCYQQLTFYHILIFFICKLGKTSFVQSFVRGHCPANHELFSMLGVVTVPCSVGYERKNKTTLDVPMHIWDINGNQRYFSLLDCYCDSLDCCILAFDVSGNVFISFFFVFFFLI